MMTWYRDTVVVLVLLSLFLSSGQAAHDQGDLEEKKMVDRKMETLETADKKGGDNDLDLASGKSLDTLLRSRAGSKNKFIEAEVSTGTVSLFVGEGDVWRILNKGSYVTIENLGRKQVATGKYLSADVTGGKISLATGGSSIQWKILGQQSTGYNFLAVDGSGDYKYLDAILEKNAVKLSPITSGKYKGTWWDMAAPPKKATPKATPKPTAAPVSAKSYKSLGCYKDQWSPRQDLTGIQSNLASQSPELCSKFCANYQYFALTITTWCLCGNSYGAYGKAPESECDLSCGGDATAKCGANSKDGGTSYRNNIYENVNYVAPSGPTLLGCFKDQWSPRQDLTGIQSNLANQSPALCSKFCSNYQYFALTITTWCLCGNSYGTYGPAATSECELTCGGDSTAKCGANSKDGGTSYRNNIYKNSNYVAPSGPILIGCFKDQWSPRQDLTGIQSNLANQSPALCNKFCSGNKYFALTITTWCICGDSYGTYGAAAASECDLQCGGDSTAKCGANSKDGGKSYRNNIYQVSNTK